MTARQRSNGYPTFFIATGPMYFFRVKSGFFGGRIFVECFSVVLISVPDIPYIQRSSCRQRNFLIYSNAINGHFRLSRLCPINFVIHVAVRRMRSQMVPFQNIMIKERMSKMKGFPAWFIAFRERQFRGYALQVSYGIR